MLRLDSNSVRRSGNLGTYSRGLPAARIPSTPSTYRTELPTIPSLSSTTSLSGGLLSHTHPSRTRQRAGIEALCCRALPMRSRDASHTLSRSRSKQSVIPNLTSDQLTVAHRCFHAHPQRTCPRPQRCEIHAQHGGREPSKQRGSSSSKGQGSEEGSTHEPRNG